MIDLDEDDLRQVCTESSFDRGERYFEKGRVRIKEATPTRVKAVVSGTDDYHVEIELNDEFSGECNCPYDLDGLCKHIVATFLAVIRNDVEIEPLMKKSNSELEDTKSLLKLADPDALRSFLLSEMQQRADLRNRFKAVFGKKGEGRSLDDYKSEAESLYDDVEDHGYVPYGEDIDFSSLSDLAELYIQKGDFLEAAKIYQALSEVIAEKMDDVDDSDGNYGGEFTDSLDAFTDCILKAGLDANGRRPYIKYLFDRYIRGNPDYFQSDYEEALTKLCREEKDWRYWKELLEPHIPGEIPGENDWMHYHDAIDLISMKLDLLHNLGEKDDFYGLIMRHFRSNDSLCLRYAEKLLADGENAKALKVAEEGVAIFEAHFTKDLRDFLSRIYRYSDPKKYRDTLQSLFLQSGDWKYYGLLKTTSKPEEWQERLSKI
ncbi:MAG: SWIM zinc finger family protein, partial [Methanothrix sp.]